MCIPRANHGCLVYFHNVLYNSNGSARRYVVYLWLTNSALVYEPKCWGRVGGGELRGVSANECSCAHRAHINFRGIIPYLTYDSNPEIFLV